MVVSGPKPVIFTDPVDQAEMRRAATAILGDWQERSRHDPDWVAWVRKRSCQAFVVLTICRLLYSLESGSVASKPVAARWAQKVLGAGRAALIQEALTGQHDERDISDSELEHSLDFIDEALKAIQNKD